MRFLSCVKSIGLAIAVVATSTSFSFARELRVNPDASALPSATARNIQQVKTSSYRVVSAKSNVSCKEYGMHFFSRVKSIFLALAIVVSATTFVCAQGFLVEPVPRRLPRVVVHPIPTVDAVPYRVVSEEINATINGSTAKVEVSQTFKNEGSSTVEASFVFPIPYDGAVDSMTLLVDGKELPGQLLDAKDARSQYEEIVRKARDPALLEWIGAGMYKTSVFPIPPKESRTVSMSFVQILRSQNGLTEFLFPIRAAQFTTKPADKIAFSLTIVGDSEIKNVYSPTYDLKIDRVGANVVKVSSSLENKLPTSDFRLFFDQNADELSAKLQSYRPDEKEDGYFLMLATPKFLDETKDAPSAKTIVFTLDVSGSMMGKKIEQARNSLSFVLSRLRDGDKFNVVLFNRDVVSYQEKLQTASEDTRRDALAYVEATRANGGTNIADALRRSFDLINQDDSANPKYVLFLSDGDATVGETNEMKLAQIAKEANKSQARVFTFGVGYDVNARLLDRLVTDGRGQGVYATDENNVEEVVSSLYSRIESPVMTETEFLFSLKSDSDKKYVVNSVYPSGKIDVYAGEQIAIVGRYSASGAAEIVAKGRVGEKEVQFKYDGEFVEKSADASYAYVERLWATRRVAEIIDELDLKGENPELVEELVALAKKHGVVTPYTSFLANESTDLNATRDNVGAASRNFDRLASQTSSSAGVWQRSLKQAMRSQSNMGEAAAEFSANANAMAAAPAPMRGMGGGGMGGGMSGAMRGRVAGGMRAKDGIRLANESPERLDVLNVVESDMALDDVDSDFLDATDAAPAERIKSIGDKTFYFKNGRWVDESITEEMLKSQKPISTTQFSDEYFKLIAANGAAMSQYLVFSEPIDLNFNGQLYKFEVENK